MTNLVDDKGFFWWGWHRYYNVHSDAILGADYVSPEGAHEIHANHAIAWDRLWAVNPAAVKKQIEAIWQWHVVDKVTGEVNRHGDGYRGCWPTTIGRAVTNLRTSSRNGRMRAQTASTAVASRRR